MIAPRARVRRRPASSQPTPSSRRRDRDQPPRHRAPCRHLKTHRGDGADAERERVVAAVAAAERAQERAEKRAERAMIAPRARVRRRPASSQPTPSSRRRDPKPPRHRAPCRHLKTHRGDGADAERERVVAAVAAAERAQERAEKRAERAMIAPRARVRRRPASSQPTPSSRRRDRDQPPRHRAPCRHLKTHRGDGADAERERVVAAVAAAERAQERAEKRAERAMIAPRARVRRRPASSQPTPSSRRRDRDQPPRHRAPCRHLKTHRGDGADAERERVVAAVAAAERAQERAEKRAERAMIAPRARVRRRPASSQPTPSSRRRDATTTPIA